ncbi:putative glycoside hydrolase [Klebsiella pneumoniae]|nr:putative glycoside hydrolase [Klebsiella pneumoniae]
MERSALPARARGWIDPCPFWDDNGQAWLVHAFAHSRSGIKHKLQLFAMAPDASELLGEGQIIYDGCCDLPTLEGQRFINAPVGTTSLLLRAGLKMAGRRYCARAR